MGIATAGIRSRAWGVLIGAVVWVMVLAGPAFAVPPDSGGGGTGAKVVVPAAESGGAATLTANVYLMVAVLALALLAIVAYRRWHRSAVASG